MRSRFVLLLCLLAATGCQQSPSANIAKSDDASVQHSDDPKTEAARFSKPKDVVLSMGSMKFMLDLDSDQTMDPPARNRPGQEKMDVHPSQQQPYELPQGLSCKSMFLVGPPLRGTRVTSNDWNASESDLRSRLASDKVQPLDQMDYDPSESATYFFTTDGGTDGILQLVALVEEPKGLRVRYKVLEPVTP